MSIRIIGVTFWMKLHIPLERRSKHQQNTRHFIGRNPNSAQMVFKTVCVSYLIRKGPIFTFRVGLVP